VLDNLGSVDDVESPAGQRLAILQHFRVDRHAQPYGPFPAVIGKFEPNRLATAGALPEIQCKAETATNVEQRASIGSGQYRPDRLPDSAADLDVKAPELFAVVLHIGEVRNVRRVVERTGTPGTADQRKRAITRLYRRDREHDGVSAGAVANWTMLVAGQHLR
jgi:hypothetical protein